MWIKCEDGSYVNSNRVWFFDILNSEPSKVYANFNDGDYRVVSEHRTQEAAQKALDRLIEEIVEEGRKFNV